MSDPKTEDHADEMEQDLHQLEGHIADAEKKLEGRKEAAGVVDDVAGDWEGEQDRGGGDDPRGAQDDANKAAPGGSQDGPGVEGGTSAEDGPSVEGGTSAEGDAGTDEDDDPDGRVAEEAASPT